MNKRNTIIISILSIILIFSLMGFPILSKADVESYTTVNKYNVVVVLDASNSINYTDSNGYRFEAISYFVNLMTDKGGNYIGSVTFSNDILSTQDITEANNQDKKNQFIDSLKETQAIGYTNIGKGIDEAVNMLLTQGDASVPSIILFFSDGNTEMPDDTQLQESLNLKADAIQRARENDIKIYSVCLNANGDADVSEMEQIANSTGGYFNEVKSPEDLLAVFDGFYNMIYSNSTVEIPTPDYFTGHMEEEFNVPFFGVEELNIVIYGMVDSAYLVKPSNNNANTTYAKSDTYTILKTSDIETGIWKVVIDGEEGAEIKINMVYNSDLRINILDSQMEYSPEEEVEIKAELESGGIVADNDAQYEGYYATLQIMDSRRNVLEEIPMNVSGGKFTATKSFDEGNYYFKVRVEGNSLNAESDEYGPVIIKTIEQTEEEPVIVNSPPEPVKNPVYKKVYKIPFKDTTCVIDLMGIATDKEDKELYYEVISSSFIAGKDYTISNNEINVTHFSLYKGAFTVRAYDSLGEYCDVEIIIKRINVGLITLIAIAVAALIVLIIIGIIIYRKKLIPFRGTINVKSIVNGYEQIDSKKPKRGSIRLSRFNVNTLGLNKNTKFQAGGGKYIDFIVKPKMIYQKEKVKKQRINGNELLTEYRLFVDGENLKDCLVISFVPVNNKRRTDNSSYGGYSGQSDNWYGGMNNDTYTTGNGYGADGGYGYGNNQNGNFYDDF